MKKFEFCEIYRKDGENFEALKAISWLNSNLGFDVSVGRFLTPDFFTFLRNMEKFGDGFCVMRDDFYFLLCYSSGAVSAIIEQINKKIKRTHEVLPLARARVLDGKCNAWIAKQNGRTIKDKLANGKLLAVVREDEVDTYENRIFKKFVKNVLEVCERRGELLGDMGEFDELCAKMSRWLKSDYAKAIDENGKVVANNILICDKHYKKIYKSYKWLEALDGKYDAYCDAKRVQTNLQTACLFEFVRFLHFGTKAAVLPNLLCVSGELKECLSVELPHKWAVSSKADSSEAEKEFLAFLGREFDKFCRLKSNVLPNLEKLKELAKNAASAVAGGKMSENSDVFFEKNAATDRATDRNGTDKNAENRELYIDLFSVAPKFVFNGKSGVLPPFFKQRIDSKVVEAVGAKALRGEFFTLPVMLFEFDSEVFGAFMSSLKARFGEAGLACVVPDFVSVFKFGKVKSALNLAFGVKKTHFMPRSVLLGLCKLYKSGVVFEDGVVFYAFDLNLEGEIFVTPLVVESVESGGVSGVKRQILARQPTKKVDEISLDELSEEATKIFKKVGVFETKNVRFFDENLREVEFKAPKFEVSFEKFKEAIFKLYPKLKEKKMHENLPFTFGLEHFKEFVEREKRGEILWRESLPNLSMEVVKDGWFEKFELVNERNQDVKMAGEKMEVATNFTLPAKQSEVRFALNYNDERTNFEAVLSSKEMPFEREVECALSLSYDYEREPAYELLFTPVSLQIEPLKVAWREAKFDLSTLVVPSYPAKKSWEELENFKSSKNGERMNLPELFLETLNFINNGSRGIFNVRFGRIVGVQSNFCFVKELGGLSDEDVFCHKSTFVGSEFEQIRKGSQIWFVLSERKDDRLRALCFSDNQDELKKKLSRLNAGKIGKKLNFLNFLVLQIWQDRTLDDMPDYFCSCVKEALEEAEKRYKFLLNDGNKEKLDKFCKVLSALHADMPEFLREKAVKNLEAFAVGECKMAWQREIFDSVLGEIVLEPRKKPSKYIEPLATLGRMFWRSESLVEVLSKEQVERILERLLASLEHQKKKFKETDVYMRERVLNMTRLLELLLALLRVRAKFGVLKPNDEMTFRFVDIVDFFIDNAEDFAKKIKQSKSRKFEVFRSFLSFDVSVGASAKSAKIPPLLYVLGVYLRGKENLAKSIKIVGFEHSEDDGERGDDEQKF